MKREQLYNREDHINLHLVFFSCILVIYLGRFFSHTLLCQLEVPVLFFPSVDLVYWCLQLVHLPQFLVSNFWIALGFDLLLLGSILASLVFYRLKLFPRVFVGLVFLYYVTFNTYAGYHFHITVAMLFMGIPFCFNSHAHFSGALYFIRIYYMFLFCSAFFWKLFRDSAFHFDQFSNIIKANALECLVYNQGTWLDSLDYFVLQHPNFAYGIYVSGILLQLSFILGFFTYKLDRYFFIAGILFCTGNYLFLRIDSFELLLFNLALFKPGQLSLRHLGKFRL